MSDSINSTDEPVKRIPPLFKIESGLDLAKWNPAGISTSPEIKSASEEALDANEQLVRDLEDRYRNPNWFKVAAGFAKPQLGGFLASVGSASNELGDWVESQRAMAPTISKMRQEIAVGRRAFAQHLEQQKLFDEYQKTTDPERKIKLAGDIYNLDPSSATGLAVKGVYDASQIQAATKKTQLGTAIEAQEAAAKYPYIDVNKFLEEGQKGNIEGAKENLIKFISDKGYHDPEGLKMKGVQELTALASQIQNQFFEKSLDNAKTASAMVDNSVSQLQNLSTARHLADSPRLEKLLGIESGNTAVSALFNWLASGGSDADFSRLSLAARQLAEKDPKAYEEFQVLRKALAVNLATARAGMANPSVASQELLAQTNPDPRMAKGAIIKLLDLQANDIGQNLGRARIMSSTKDANGNQLDPNQLRNSTAYRSITDIANARKKSILEGGYMNERLPDFYNPYYEAPTTKIPGEKTKPKKESQEGAGSVPTIPLDAIKEALARKKKQP